MPSGKQTVDALENQYGKLLAIVIRKYKLGKVVINSDDILSAMKGDGINLIVQELEDGIHLRVVSDTEAFRLQSLEHKLFPPDEPGSR